MPEHTASQILYILLQKQSLDQKDPMYQNYIQSETLQEELAFMAADFQCTLAPIRGSLYLVPDDDNNFLGFSRAKLKEKLAGNQPIAYYYLSLFFLLTLLNEFYGTEYGSGRTREFLELPTLMNKVTSTLRQRAELENDSQVPFAEMYNTFNSLEPPETNRRAAATQLGLLRRLFQFLEEQKLVHLVGNAQEDFLKIQIRPTRKLNDLMDARLRSDQGWQAMMKLLQEEPCQN